MKERKEVAEHDRPTGTPRFSLGWVCRFQDRQALAHFALTNLLFSSPRPRRRCRWYCTGVAILLHVEVSAPPYPWRSATLVFRSRSTLDFANPGTLCCAIPLSPFSLLSSLLVHSFFHAIAAKPCPCPRPGYTGPNAGTACAPDTVWQTAFPSFRLPNSAGVKGSSPSLDAHASVGYG